MAVEERDGLPNMHGQRRDMEEESEKPQHKFKIVLADSSPAPFLHLGNLPNGLNAQHPFSNEIQKLLQNPCEAPISFDRIDDEPPPIDGPCIWIDTIEQLHDLANTLSKEKEIAVDIEHHSVRSYLGFIALIQISTNKQDFLIDAIMLHDQLSILRPVFANPNICKVFHGADSDSIWLQRDFHIYIVNLFDTARACDVLSKPQRSLAYLLQSYCGVSTNKIYQVVLIAVDNGTLFIHGFWEETSFCMAWPVRLADWRRRPLPEAMVHYARVDAHYLLYVARQLCVELLQGDGMNESVPGYGLRETMRRSNLMSLQLYEKDRSSASPSTAAASIIARFHYGRDPASTPKVTDTQFQKLVRNLCIWRDRMARLEDESLRYILSDAAILALAKHCPVSPETIESTIAAADSIPQDSDSVPASPSSIVKREINALLTFLCRASDASRPELLSSPLGSKDAPIKSGSEASISQLHYEDKMLLKLNDSDQANKRNSMNIIKKRVPIKSKQTENARFRFVKHFACKSPVYDNCRIYAGDDRLLCYCDRKKIKWYLQRGLAESLNEDPPAIRLLFEPKGRPEDEDNDFYVQRKSNRCVSCGETGHYLRYRIIPYCYRQHFPEHLKSHRSHDIVLLCVDCHEIAHQSAEEFKKKIATEHGIPLNTEEPDAVSKSLNSNACSSQTNKYPRQIKRIMLALLLHGSSMPVQRKEELENVIKTYFDGRHVTEQEMIAYLKVGISEHAQKRLLKSVNSKLNSLTGSIAIASSHAYLKSQSSCEQDGSADWQRMPTGNQKHEFESSDEPARACGLISVDDCTISAAMTPNPLNSFNSNACFTASDCQGNGDLMKLGAHPEDGTSLEENSPVEDQEFITELSDKVTKICFDAATVYSSTSIMVSTSPLRISSDGTTNQTISSEVEDGKREVIMEVHDHGVAYHHGGHKHRKHGKKVVEAILEKEGEHGIQTFCQKWRSVFVDALKPSFLPSGWDVCHKGWREFGEFSIYNRNRKDSQSEN